MIKCPSCGSELKYEISSGNITCEYCGNSFNPEELNVKANESEEIKDGKTSIEAKRFLCSQCGAELLTFDDTAVTFCSYCGSQSMIESRLIKINNPDYIIPFKKTKEECIKNYKKKLRRNIFAPRYMKSNLVVNKFRGIFMPYVVYKLSIHGDCSNTGEKYRGRVGDYIKYDDYAIVSNIDVDYDGFSYDLASKYYDKFSNSIPFDLSEKKDFNINYLSGYYADKKDVSIIVYDDLAKRVSRLDASLKLSKKREYRKYKCEKVLVPLEIMDRKTAMLPVYFLSVKDKDNKHINYAVVNGQTGEVAADVPIDFMKYIIFTLIIGVLIFLLINEYLVFLPKNMLIISIFISIISGIISNKQLNEMTISKEKKDDLGVISQDSHVNLKKVVSQIDYYRYFYSNFLNIIKLPIFMFLLLLVFGLLVGSSFETLLIIIVILFIITALPLFIYLLFSKFVNYCRRKIEDKETIVIPSSLVKKIPFKEKVTKYLYKQIIAFIVALAIIILNPVDDFYYYAGCIFTLSMVVFSFYDFVKERNEIISNQLPQLEKRGGDENE